MGGNINNVIVGKCGKCGGVVSMPKILGSVNRPPQTCESCGATVQETAGLATLPMNDAPKGEVLWGGYPLSWGDEG